MIMVMIRIALIVIMMMPNEQLTASEDKVNEESARKGVNDDTAVVLKSGSLPVRARITNHN